MTHLPRSENLCTEVPFTFPLESYVHLSLQDEAELIERVGGHPACMHGVSAGPLFSCLHVCALAPHVPTVISPLRVLHEAAKMDRSSGICEPGPQAA